MEDHHADQETPIATEDMVVEKITATGQPSELEATVVAGGGQAGAEDGQGMLVEAHLEWDEGLKVVRVGKANKRGGGASKGKTKEVGLGVRMQSQQGKAWSEKEKNKKRLTKACEKGGVGPSVVSGTEMSREVGLPARSQGPLTMALNPNAQSFVPGTKGKEVATERERRVSSSRLQRSTSEGRLKGKGLRVSTLDEGFLTDCEDTTEGEDTDLLGDPEVNDYYGTRRKGRGRSTRGF